MRSSFSLILIVLISGCIDFSIDREEMNHSFKDEAYIPVSNILTIDSANTHYVFIDNHKDNLAVFIHGSPGSWSAFIDFLKNDSLLESYDVVAIDRPGYGLSDRGRPIASMEKQAELMALVISQFDHTNKVLVGHSLGGPVIARVAMDYPDLVSKLVFVAPSIDPEQEKYEWYRSWIDTKVGGWLTPTDFWVSNEEILPLKEELVKMLPLWDNIAVESIVIQGTEDVLVPKENAEFARRMLRDSMVQIRYIEDANHFIPWSHPETIVKALVDLKN
ncbi:MAG: alpha/beta hydrolase [Flammeovirgaceae bacterium]|nr:alpha/beta hydrolase [Flammeovirgaceae bacterium]HCX20745.1 alpha/beta hydrolase [Cytophagales bacterium]